MLTTAVLLKPPETSPSRIEALFHEHEALVFRAAYRITGSAAEAEDVLQTVFLRLMQQPESPATSDEEKLTGAYVHRAAINCGIGLVRKRRRDSNVPIDSVFSTIAEVDARTPQSDHEESELGDLLRKAIARLNQKSAEVFVLRYFEGKSNDEIADALQTSPFVVAVMLHRARTRLRGEMSKFLEKHHEAE